MNQRQYAVSPGTRKKITIDEIAKEAFVSRSVVSRVLNDRPNVSPEARLRVLEAIKRFDYRPDSKARGLATHRTKEICTIIPRRTDGVLATGYWPLVLLGIAERSAHRGYFQTMSAISNPSEAEFMARIVSESRFDGFVLVRREVTRLVAAAIVERDV
ncbi:MAG TPA: LacI family DNA-binding transcriptional regulator, partial [Rhodothermia bacterium]|nr:LacI family DNA-binding transcriptional regulator [Rhodothermia bacterium]